MKHLNKAVLCISFTALCFGFWAVSLSNAESNTKQTESEAVKTRHERVSNALSQLNKALSMKDLKAAQAQLDSLGPEAEPDLRAVVDDKKNGGHLRFKALKTIHGHYSEDQRRQEVIKAFAEDKDPDYRMDLAQNMGGFKDAETLKVLKDALNNPKENVFVQAGAALALAARHDESGKERSLKAILNAEPGADFAIQTLVVLKAKDVFPILDEKAKTSKDYSQKNYCHWAKLRIQFGMAEPKDRFKLLAEAIKEDGFFQSSQWAAERLAEMGGDAASKLLVDLVKNGSGVKSQHAYDGLMLGVQDGKWTQEDVRKWLAK